MRLTGALRAAMLWAGLGLAVLPGVAAGQGVLANLPVTLRGLDGRPLPVRLTLMQSQENGETYLDSVAVASARGEDGVEPAMALGMAVDREVLVAS